MTATPDFRALLLAYRLAEMQVRDLEYEHTISRRRVVYARQVFDQLYDAKAVLWELREQIDAALGLTVPA